MRSASVGGSDVVGETARVVVDTVVMVGDDGSLVEVDTDDVVVELVDSGTSDVVAVVAVVVVGPGAEAVEVDVSASSPHETAATRAITTTTQPSLPRRLIPRSSDDEIRL